MEIKVGDKVRIANDAPSEYRYGFNYRLRTQESEVVGLDDNGFMAAILPLCVSDRDLWFQIPTKYLIKVDAEAKEPKFKVGDKVRKKKWDKDTTISCVEWHGTWQTFVYRFAEQEYGFNCHKEDDITLVSRRAKEPKFKAGDCVKISFEWGELPVGEKLVIKGLETIDCRNAYMYSIEGYRGTVIESMLHPYTELTAPTIKVGDRVRNIESGLIGVVDKIVYGNVAWVNGVDGKRYHWKSNDLELVQPKEQTEAKYTKTKGDTLTFPIAFDLSDSYWDAYTADLARDIAVKIVNKNMGSDPEKVGEYAVNVAKSVVEELKRK